MSGLLENRAKALIDANQRVTRARRKAFPDGQCSYDKEWQEATRALEAEYRRSAVMVARGFLALVAAAPEQTP